MFIQQFVTAIHREEIRKNTIENYNTNSKEDYLGPLESEKKCKDWELNFINYLSTLIVFNGFPLSYLVLKNYNPYSNGVSLNFIYNTISCAPLKCNYHKYGYHTVHKALVSFTIGKPSEDWTRDNLSCRDGKRSMKLLRNNFSVYASRKITESEKLCDLIFYKNERSM